MNCFCPVCGRDIPQSPAVFVEDRGIVVANGCFAVLTGTEGQIMQKLIQSFPNVADKEKIHEALYAFDPDGGAEPKIVDVLICKLRKKLTPLGVDITTSWGRGYALGVKVNKNARIAKLEGQ